MGADVHGMFDQDMEQEGEDEVEELLSDPCPRCHMPCELSDTRSGECFSIACECESGKEEEDGDEEQEEEGDAPRIELRELAKINYAESGGQAVAKGKGRKGPGRRKGSLNDSDAGADESTDDEDTVLVPFLVYDNADKTLKTPSDFDGGFTIVQRKNVGLFVCCSVARPCVGVD
jgi:hypothetical protein